MERKVRPSALAGTWYEGSPAGLDAQIDGLLGEVPRRVAGEVCALLEPHAGYRYSGKGAAAGYQVLAGRDYRRVVVMGPSHYSGFHGYSIAPATHFATPLGEKTLDLEALEPLRRNPLHRDLPSAHIEEHSIEIQVPFLQKLLPQATLVPVMIGQLERKDYPVLADELRALAGPETLFIASSDFTHQGRRFGFQPFTHDLPSNIRALDLGGFEPITRLDPDGFLDYVDRTGITICGFRPIGVLLHLLPPGTQCQKVSYYTSGDVLGEWDSSVSYLTAVFQKPDPHPPFQADLLDAESRTAALALAREVITRHCHGQGPAPLGRELPEGLRQRASCFVTLQKGNDLRGCIGRIDAHGPLYESILSNAVSAASEDPRFTTVRLSELDEIRLEISVLTPPERIAGPEHIELGRHGVILEKWGRRSVFLPQVAVDQVWSVPEMLDQLARKAGLGPGAWRDDTRFEVFSCQVFAEGDAE